MGQFYSGVARGFRTGLIVFRQPWQRVRKIILSGQAGIVLTSGFLTGDISPVTVNVKGQYFKSLFRKSSQSYKQNETTNQSFRRSSL